ncbi:MAG: hypothetical protein CXZ00_02020 [Acidobacteria bacterium]|nr:MAG: hypothetical protein CXZ00_02020 [Acidobacteriota bacterium]
MKSYKLLGTLMALLLLVPVCFAQGSYNHAEVGVFMNYTRLSSASDTNFYGIGGRIGANVHPHIQLEAEGAYDFEQNVNSQINLGGGSFTSQRSNLRMIHFLFGPKFQAGTSGPVRLFATLKGGLLDFSTDRRLSGQILNIPSDTNGVFYPAGGVELFSGWFGVRFEVGDEIYFDRGANNNLRVTAGPTFRF